MARRKRGKSDPTTRSGYSASANGFPDAAKFLDVCASREGVRTQRLTERQKILRAVHILELLDETGHLPRRT